MFCSIRSVNNEHMLIGTQADMADAVDKELAEKK